MLYIGAHFLNIDVGAPQGYPAFLLSQTLDDGIDFHLMVTYIVVAMIKGISLRSNRQPHFNTSREPPAAHASLSVRAYGGLHASGFSSFCRKMAAHGGWREEGGWKRAVPPMYGLLYFM